MGDNSDESSDVPKRKPPRFKPNIPCPKKTKTPPVSKMESPDDANSAADSDMLKKTQYPGNSEEKQLPMKYEPSSSDSEGSSDGDATDVSKKQRIEFTNSSYKPINLPWGSDAGNPEPGKASVGPAAVELGLMEESKAPRLLLVQMPKSLPLVNQSAVDATGSESRGCSMQDLPAGFIGKMQVYKSGRVKMKMGDNSFDVSSGVQAGFAQDVAAINTKEKNCCTLGKIDKRAVVTPDLDTLGDDSD